MTKAGGTARGGWDGVEWGGVRNSTMTVQAQRGNGHSVQAPNRSSRGNRT